MTLFYSMYSTYDYFDRRSWLKVFFFCLSERYLDTVTTLTQVNPQPSCEAATRASGDHAAFTVVFGLGMELETVLSAWEKALVKTTS